MISFFKLSHTFFNLDFLKPGFLTIGVVIALVFAAIFLCPSQAVAGELSYTLPNGLKVILAPQPGKPVIAARVDIKAGSASEIGVAEQGLAHLMEHMAFKGTSKRAAGEISSLIESSGGDTNAYTSYDQTSYYIIMPSENLSLTLDLLSDMVFSPAYDPEEYRREKEVVIEEIRMGEDNPGSQLINAFFKELFGEDHPYGHKVLGSPETVRNASRETALAFHKKFYRPDNAILVITGGFDAGEAEGEVLKWFGELKNPEGAFVPTKAPSIKLDGPKAMIIRSKETTVPKLILGFHSPAAGDSRTPSVDLLSAIFSEGRSGRFQERIQNKKGLVSSISSSAIDLKMGSAYAIIYETDGDKVLPALREVVSEINAINSEPPREEELTRARALVSKEFVDGQEAPWDLAGTISAYEIYGGDYRLKDAYLPAWSRLEPDDLVYEASEIFVPENAFIVLILPEAEEKADSQPQGSTITPEELRAELLKLKVSPPGKETLSSKRGFEERVLSNGAKVLIKRDSNLPKVSLRAGTLAGRLNEPSGKEGVNNLMSLVWTMASKDKDTDSMAIAMDDLGLRMGGFSASLTTGIEAAFLSEKWRESLSLFTELLITPAFSQKDFELKKRQELDHLLSLDESLSQRVMRMLRLELFQDHPFRLDKNGTLETVNALTREDVLGSYEKLSHPENFVFSVIGDIDPDSFIKALEEDLKDWKPKEKGIKVIVPEGPQPFKDLQVAGEALERAQTHLIFGFLAPDYNSPDLAPLEVLNAIFSGMGGILFTELRDKRSLAYSVSSGYSPSWKIGSFIVYIGTAPEKTPEAYEGVLRILSEARDKPFSPELIQGAKTRLIGLNLMGRLTISSLGVEALNLSLTDRPLDYNDRYLENIAKVTPEDIQRVARKYLRPETGAVAVLGDEVFIKHLRELAPQSEAGETKDAKGGGEPKATGGKG
jgi:zinc protease